jgi:DNA adenine methylase
LIEEYKRQKQHIYQMKLQIKTPISYYGGKQKLVSTILPFIPEHKLYCEPFCGGAAVFWAKEPSKVEIINDLNSEVINFYRVLQKDFTKLYKMVNETLHSRQQHTDANVIYQHPHMFNQVQRAWAFWVQCNQSFASKINAGWAYARVENTCEKKTHNTKARFKQLYQDRLKFVQIECNNALQVNKSRDCDDAFHYVDPPYPDSDQGHYEGYTLGHFEELLKVLVNIKGKFLLSSYDYPLLDQYAETNGWHQIKIKMLVSASKADKAGKREKYKVEVFTANYPIKK